VLLHGWPVTREHWRYLVPALGAAGFDPILLTLPGLGAPAGLNQSFRKTDLAAWVRETLTAQGISRFALVGHDWGGTVAVHVAAATPGAVTSLVVEEEVLPGVDVDGSDYYPSWHGPFNRAPGLAEALVPGREAAYYGTFLRQSAGPPGLEAEQSYIDAYSTPGMLDAGLSYYRARDDDLADTERLAADPIATPALAIGGRYALGSGVADGLRHVANNVTGVVFDHSGHYPVEQEPEQTSAAITEFLG
jgi:pimeloyl-ACP methyl ester carboxylesterase